MKHKLECVIKELEKWGHTSRQQQKLSRDEKKQWYYLAESNQVAKTIGLLRRTFHQELSQNQIVPLTDSKNKV